MKWKFYRNLGACDPPQAPKHKEIWPAIIAAVGALGAAGVSAYQNLKSQADTNESNERNVEKTNKLNAKMHEQDIALQRYQFEKAQQENRFLVNQAWQREQQYKDPKKLRDAYLRAGINPAFAMQSGAGFGSVPSSTVGSPPSSPSVPSSHPMLASQAVAPLYDYSGISDAFSKALQAKQLESDIEFRRGELDLKTLDILSQIKNRDWHNQRLRAEIGSVLDELAFNRQTWKDRAKSVALANDALDSDIRQKDSQTAYQNIINQFEPDRQKKILESFDDQHEQIMSAIRSNDADSAYKYALKALTNAQENGVNMDNQLKEDTADAYVDAMFSKAEADYWNSEAAGRRYLLGDKVGPTTPAMDLNGKTYSSPTQTYRYKRPWRNSKVRSKVYVAQ